MNNKINQLDSYSILICSKYFELPEDYLNIICACKKFKETTEKLRFNPIPIKSLKLFPKIQTQYLYSNKDEKIEEIGKYEIWYIVDYVQYLFYNESNIKCHHISYSKQNRDKYGEIIPSCVSILDCACFQDSKITSIIIHNNTTAIGSSCFEGCHKLTNILLTNQLTCIVNNCFSKCSLLPTIHLPSSIQTLGHHCFSDCSNLQSINIPNSVTLIDNRSFLYCTSLRSIIIPTTIKKLHVFTFSCCFSLTNVELPTTLISIDSNCFRKCTSLTSITLPSSLKYLGTWCFSACSNLISINGIEEVKIGEKCFYGCHKLIKKPKNKKKDCIIN
ncbi:hypothetical protein QTN25_003191 [Entamoeba marina]